jgi:two-component system, NtrC family, response regulator HydG
MFKTELNKYWKTVVDTIQDGVMIVDTRGTIVSVNQGFEKITGYPQNEILGKPCSVLNCSTCDIVRKAQGCHWCTLFRKGTMRRSECVLMRKDGSYIHVVKNASVLKDQKGEVSGAVETITDISDLLDKETQIERFRRELESEDRRFGMVGNSASMQSVFELIADTAESDAPVIIYGESGTGKELVARAIHENGWRREKPYVKVNCAALNESLLESELFGHVKGAFTGAYKNRDGRFAAAGEGSIFLDEIGDLPLSTQVKLLRVLEEKVVERVGDNLSVSINARVISATNRELRALVDKGAFREDFFYRINVVPIWIPPLRERISDIPLLAESFFRRILLKSGKKIEGISNEALEAIIQYRWPGNVRELKSAFEYAFVSCHDPMIQPHHFPPDVTRREPVCEEPLQDKAYSIDDIKKNRLMEALAQTGGNQSQAAKILGISRTSVWSQMKRYRLRA